MGTILFLENADFSENAVPVENLYDIVKQTDIDVATPKFEMVGRLKYYNSIPLSKSVKIYAVSFVLRETADVLKPKVGNKIAVGTTDGNTILRKVSINIKDIVSDFKAGIIAGGSKHTVLLPESLIVNAGEYIMFGNDGDPTDVYRIVCYARVSSGNYGTMRALGEEEVSSYNLAATFYGVELD